MRLLEKKKKSLLNCYVISHHLYNSDAGQSLHLDIEMLSVPFAMKLKRKFRVNSCDEKTYTYNKDRGTLKFSDASR